MGSRQHPHQSAYIPTSRHRVQLLAHRIMVAPFAFFRRRSSTSAPTVTTDITPTIQSSSSATSPVIQSLQDSSTGGRMSCPISRRQSPTIATTPSNAMASPRPTLPPGTMDAANSQAADMLRSMAQRYLRHCSRFLRIFLLYNCSWGSAHWRFEKQNSMGKSNRSGTYADKIATYVFQGCRGR